MPSSTDPCSLCNFFLEFSVGRFRTARRHWLWEDKYCARRHGLWEDTYCARRHWLWEESVWRLIFRACDSLFRLSDLRSVVLLINVL